MEISLIWPAHILLISSCELKKILCTFLIQSISIFFWHLTQSFYPPSVSGEFKEMCQNVLALAAVSPGFSWHVSVSDQPALEQVADCLSATAGRTKVSARNVRFSEMTTLKLHIERSFL